MHSLRDFFSRRAHQKAASTAPGSLTPDSINNSDNNEAGSPLLLFAGLPVHGKPGSTGSTLSESGGDPCAQATTPSEAPSLPEGSTSARSSFMALNMSSIGLALNNIGLPAPPTAPRFLRALSRGASANRVASAENVNKKNVSTPLLSCCSKEVAEDPFARVCPSPVYTKQHSKSSSTATSTSSTRSHTPSRSVTSVSDYFPRSPTSLAPISPISSTGSHGNGNHNDSAWSFSSSPVSTAPSSYVPSRAYLSPATGSVSAAAAQGPLERVSFDSDDTIVTESCVSKTNSGSSAPASSPKKRHLAARHRHRRRSSSVGRGAGLPMPPLSRGGRMDSAGSSQSKRAKMSIQVISESYNRQRAPLPPSFSRAATSPAEMVHPAAVAPSMSARPSALVVDTNVYLTTVAAGPFGDLLDAPDRPAASHAGPTRPSLTQEEDLCARSFSQAPAPAFSDSSIRSTTSSRFIEHLDEHFGTSRNLDIDLSPLPVPSRWSSSSRHLLLSPGFPHPDSIPSDRPCLLPQLSTPDLSLKILHAAQADTHRNFTHGGTTSASTSRSSTPTLLSRLVGAGNSGQPHARDSPDARPPRSTALPDERFERLAYARSPGPPPQPLPFSLHISNEGVSAERAVTHDYSFFGADGTKVISPRPVVMLRKNQSMPLLSAGARVAPKQMPEPSAGQERARGGAHSVNKPLAKQMEVTALHKAWYGM